MKSAWLVMLALVPGCFSTEASLGREGLVRGDASGGVAMNLLAATYRETGKQNIAAGVDMQLLQEGTDGIHGALGAGARFAQQLGDSGAWRGFSRASFGVEHCRLMSCKPDMQVPHREVFEVQLGIERMLIAPDAEKPQDSSAISAELGVVYTHATDETLGTANFIGLAIGLHVQVNALARSSPSGSGK